MAEEAAKSGERGATAKAEASEKVAEKPEAEKNKKSATGAKWKRITTSEQVKVGHSVSFPSDI